MNDTDLSEQCLCNMGVALGNMKLQTAMEERLATLENEEEEDEDDEDQSFCENEEVSTPKGKVPVKQEEAENK